MKSTAPRYCSTYVFFVFNVGLFKISIQNCPFSFTRYTVFQSHARPISVSHTSTNYSNSVSNISFSLQCSTVVSFVLSSFILISNVAAYLSKQQWRCITQLTVQRLMIRDYVSTRLIVPRLTVRKLIYVTFIVLKNIKIVEPGLGLDVSLSRRSRDAPKFRLGLVSTKNDNVSVSSSSWEADVSVSSRSRLFTSPAQDVIFDQIMQATLIK